MPVARTLRISRVNRSVGFSRPGRLLWARIMSGRNTVTGRPVRSCASRSRTSPAHLPVA